MMMGGAVECEQEWCPGFRSKRVVIDPRRNHRHSESRNVDRAQEERGHVGEEEEEKVEHEEE